jgi:hypothetical protein
VIITGLIALDAPDAARHFDSLPDAVRVAELRRALELGTHAIETIGASTTLRMVEAEIAGMSTDLSGKLLELLTTERGQSHTALRDLLEDHRTRIATSLNKYLDPESNSSLPVALERQIEQGAQDLYGRVQTLLGEGNGSPLGRLEERLTKEIDSATAAIIEQVGARRALLTKSALAGRPYEDCLEEQLLTLARPLGDTVVRCADTLGQARRKCGDLLITVNPNQVRGQELRIVVEAKRRAQGSSPFSEADIRNSLSLARRNRAADAGLFVVENSAVLPLGLGFQELGSTDIAVAFEPESGDVALAVAMRLLRWSIITSATPTSDTQLDREAAKEVIADLRQRMATIQGVQGHQQAAINSVTKASAGVKDLEDAILSGLRRLDELL